MEPNMNYLRVMKCPQYCNIWGACGLASKDAKWLTFDPISIVKFKCAFFFLVRVLFCYFFFKSSAGFSSFGGVGQLRDSPREPPVTAEKAGNINLYRSEQTVSTATENLSSLLGYEGEGTVHKV